MTIVIVSAAPTYNITLTPSATSANVSAGGTYYYTVTVNNIGDTDGNYNLTVSDSDSTNFSASVLGSSILYVTSGGSNQTTVNVIAQGGATVGAIDTSTVLVTSLDNSSYSNSTQLTTTVQIPSLSVSVTLTPSSQSVGANGQVNYAVTVQNTGNIADSYILSLNSANTSDFSYALASASTGQLDPGQQFNTTITVNRNAEATVGNTHIQSVIANGTASSTSNSVTTTVIDQPTLFVTTNRFVILDDPNNGIGKYAQSTSTFIVPNGDQWEVDLWNNDRTTITLYAMLMDENGFLLNNVAVNFTVRNWGSNFSEDLTTVYTDSDGIATSTFNMDDSDYYGNWYVDANAMDLTETSNFIYNWWGCMANGDCIDRSDHDADVTGPMSATSGEQNSPYTLGREDVTIIREHKDEDDGSATQDNSNCVGCHRSYSGEGGGGGFENQANNTPGVHSTFGCYECHGDMTTHNDDQPIKSCDDGGCHTRTESDISDMNTMPGSPARSNYSGGTGPAKYHGGPAIPCIMCHGPMHNITKPDETQRFIANSDTEDSHCTTCHTLYNQHDSSVKCTQCHTQDVHVIKYFTPSGDNTTTKSGAGNCTTCHQKTTMDARITSPRTPPKVNDPMAHSDNFLNGTLWDNNSNYWTNNTQLTMCYYCHGNTVHNNAALGNLNLFKGSNTVGSTLEGGTWCAGCHYQDNSNYDTMFNVLSLIPPEITNTSLIGTFADDGTTNYYNHTLKNYSDNRCVRCHWDSVATKPTSISNLVHNVSSANGGPDCISCHDLGMDVERVDVAAMNLSTSIHSELNSNATDTTDNADNKMCWGCHQTNGTQPIAHPDRMDTPYECYDCHSGNALYANVSSAPAVWEHFKSGMDISVSSAADNSSSCVLCHKLDEMKSSYTEPDTDWTNLSVASHYGKNTLPDTVGDFNASEGCVFCHRDATNASKWGNATNLDVITVPREHTEDTNEECWTCHIVGNITVNSFHNVSLASGWDPACIGCHYSYQYMSNSGVPTKYVNETMVGESVHATLVCANCHTDSSREEHPPAQGNRKACEDCHVVQSDPVNDTNRHNITSTPSLYMINGTSVVEITDCTICHDSTIYNNSKTNFNRDAAADCDYCHTYPDKNRDLFY